MPHHLGHGQGTGQGRRAARAPWLCPPRLSFKRAPNLLDNSLGDLTWILRVSNYYADSDADEEDDHIGLPPAALNKPILFYIWEQITVL